MDDKTLKDAFAAELLRTPDPFKAACAVVGSQDMGRALQISHEWAKDPYVIDKQAELLEQFGAKHFLPSKEDFARKVLELGDTARATEDRLKAYRLFGEIMGYIEKPTTNINNNVMTANKVMIVREQASNEAWEAKLFEQQRNLAHASARH